MTTRDDIIEHAMTLFGDKGYEAVSLREIAAVSGISLGTLYYYFREKHLLWEHVVFTAFDQRFAQFNADLKAGDTLRESLHNLFSTIVHIICDDAPMNKVARRVLVELHTEAGQEWTKRLNGVTGIRQRESTRFVRRIAPDCDPIELSLILYNLAWGKVILQPLEDLLPSRQGRSTTIVDELTQAGLYVIEGMMAAHKAEEADKRDAPLEIARHLRDEIADVAQRVDTLVRTLGAAPSSPANLC